MFVLWFDILFRYLLANKIQKALSLKDTIQKEGLFGSIICRRYGNKFQILDGEHRMKACKELGWTDLPVECAKNEMTNQEVQFWTIYFNNTRGKDDIEKRSKILEGLEEGQAQLLPFTAEEIENEKALFKFDFAQYKPSDDTVVNDLNHVLSLKFNAEEWVKVSEAMEYAIQEKLNPKQWFLVQAGLYLDMKLFRQHTPGLNS